MGRDIYTTSWNTPLQGNLYGMCYNEVVHVFVVTMLVPRLRCRKHGLDSRNPLYAEHTYITSSLYTAAYTGFMWMLIHWWIGWVEPTPGMKPLSTSFPEYTVHKKQRILTEQVIQHPLLYGVHTSRLISCNTIQLYVTCL